MSNKLYFNDVVYDLDLIDDFKSAVENGAVIIEVRDDWVFYKNFEGESVSSYHQFVSRIDLEDKIREVGIYLNEYGVKEILNFSEYISLLWCLQADDIIRELVNCSSFDYREYYDSDDEFDMQINHFKKIYPNIFI